MTIALLLGLAAPGWAQGPSRGAAATPATPAVGAAPAPALSGPSISPDTVNATTIGPAQQREIDTFVQWAGGVMTSPATEEKQVSDTRANLIGYLQKGGSAAFNRAYTVAALAQIGPALGHERELVRLNAMILVASLNDPATLPPLRKGLADANAAVRYWSSRGLGRARAGNLIAGDAAREIAAELGAAVTKEPSPWVVKEMLLALAGFPGNEAQPLGVINARIDAHLGDPDLNPEAERAALEVIYRQLVERAGRPDAAASADTHRLMAIASYRWMAASVDILEKRKLSPATEAAYRRMIELCDIALPWAVKQLQPNAAAVPTLGQDLKTRNFAAVRLSLRAWAAVLAADPINAPAKSLEVTTLKQG